MGSIKTLTVYAVVVHEHEVGHGIPGCWLVHVVRALIVVGACSDLGHHDVTRRFPVTRLVVRH